MENDAVFQELVDTENELVDSYVRGEITGPERQEFEACYLTLPERRERVANARALLACAQTAKQKETAAGGPTLPLQPHSAVHVRTISEMRLRLAVAAMLLVAFSAVVWMAIENQRLRRDLESARNEFVRVMNHERELAQELEGLKAKPPAPVAHGGAVPPQAAHIVALTLMPGLARGGAQGTTLVLPPQVTAVQIILDLEAADFAAYSAVLQTPEGKQLWRKAGLHSEKSASGGLALKFTVPAARLKSGDYILKLTGLSAGHAPEDAGAYSFRAVKQ
jgi:hypothetical protein